VCEGNSDARRGSTVRADEAVEVEAEPEGDRERDAGECELVFLDRWRESEVKAYADAEVVEVNDG
jgi:hypothetical protein